MIQNKYVFIMLTMLFFFLRDGSKIKEYLISLAKDEKQEKLLLDVGKLLRAIIRGYFAAAIIIGVVAWVFFMLLGFEYSIILAIGVGLGALFPIIGVWIVYIPLIVYEFLIGNYVLGAMLIGVAVFVIFLELYLSPKISSYKGKIHTGIMLLGFIGGPLVFGMKGLILGPMILGTLKLLLDQFRTNVEKKK